MRRRRTLKAMNFFGVGPAELILILVVALVFVGPERLPRMAADIARTIRDVRRYTSGLANEFSEVVKDFEKETETERGEWKQIGEGIGAATRSVTEALHAARTAAEDDAPAAATSPGPAPAATSAPEPPGAWQQIGSGLGPPARTADDAPAPPHTNGTVPPAAVAEDGR